MFENKTWKNHHPGQFIKKKSLQPTPLKINMSPKKGTISIGNTSEPTIIFKGIAVSFQGGKPTKLLANPKQQERSRSHHFPTLLAPPWNSSEEPVRSALRKVVDLWQALAMLTQQRHAARVGIPGWNKGNPRDFCFQPVSHYLNPKMCISLQPRYIYQLIHQKKSTIHVPGDSAAVTFSSPNRWRSRFHH